MVLGLSKALSQVGVEVTVLTTNSNGDAGQAPLDVPLGQLLPQDGYQMIYFPYSPFRRYKFSLDLLGWLASHAKDYDVAHIHALFSPVSTAAATVARYRGLPYILRPFGTLDPADLRKKRWLKKVYGFFLERPNLAAASGVHFTSQEECRISYRFGSQTRDIVIPLGVEFPDTLPEFGQTRHSLGISPDLPLILFMSRIEPKKGLNLLIPALEMLLAEGHKFHFVLAGSNPQDPAYEQQIHQHIRESKLAKSTTVAGFVRGDLKWGLLQDADIFALPSYYENFGIAVAEAMAMGTPVVISDRVHIWDAVEEAGGGWICTCQVEAVAEQLRLALKDSQERKQRGNKARQLVLDKYTWSAIAQQTVAAYKNLLRSSKKTA